MSSIICCARTYIGLGYLNECRKHSRQGALSVGSHSPALPTSLRPHHNVWLGMIWQQRIESQPPARRRPAGLDGMHILSDHGCRVTTLRAPEMILAAGVWSMRWHIFSGDTATHDLRDLGSSTIKMQPPLRHRPTALDGRQALSNHGRREAMLRVPKTDLVAVNSDGAFCEAAVERRSLLWSLQGIWRHAQASGRNEGNLSEVLHGRESWVCYGIRIS